MPQFSLSRFVRTPNSEMYYIHADRRRRKDGTNPAVAELHLHIQGKLYVGALLLWVPLKEDQVNALVHQIEALIDDSEFRDDFLLSIYRVEEVAERSDSIPDERRRWEPPLRKDLEELDDRLRQVIGRHQVARGLLNEHALVEFLESLGYAAKRAGAAADHDGIDVVATKDDIIVYAQAKLGEADGRALAKLATAVATRPTEGATRRVGLLAGDRFPSNIEFLRMELEAKHGISLACVEKATVLRAAKSYRRVLD